MAYYRPQPGRREVAVAVASTAMLLIDVQNYNCHPRGAVHAHCRGHADDDCEHGYFFQQVERTIPKWQKLLDICRSKKIEVMFTVIQSLTMNGRDRGLDYVLSGFHVPPGCWDARVLDPLRPGPDEIVLPKTSSSVFNSTNIDYILKNLGVTQLILCGCLTDQCVEHAVRDACDRGYLVTLVTDASITHTEQRQEASLKAVAGYCRQRTTEEMTLEIESLKSERSQS